MDVTGALDITSGLDSTQLHLRGRTVNATTEKYQVFKSAGRVTRKRTKEDEVVQEVDVKKSKGEKQDPKK